MATIDVPESACMRLARLRAEHERLVLGAGASEVEHEQGNGVRERVRFHQADLARLDALIVTAQRECALELGMVPATRRPIIGGTLGAAPYWRP